MRREIASQMKKVSGDNTGAASVVTVLTSFLHTTLLSVSLFRTQYSWITVLTFLHTNSLLEQQVLLLC